MRHRARALVKVAIACAALLSAAPGAALATANPVHVDPKSPVAKEYAIPLATARGAAPESGQSGALFGSGITSSTHPSSASTQASGSTPPPSANQPPVSAKTTTAGQPTPSPPLTTTDTTSTVTLTRTTATNSASSTTATRSSSKTSGTPAVQAAPAAYKVLRAGSGSGLLWMVLAGALVVALGSAGGYALSRRR